MLQLEFCMIQMNSNDILIKGILSGNEVPMQHLNLKQN